MDDLLDSAAALWRDSGVGHELRLIGGLAVRDVTISVAGVDDLAVLKLLAMRDQDLVDLLLLAAGDLSVDAIVRSAENNDIERSVSAGAHHARHALRTGTLRDIFQQTLSREPEERDLVRLEGFLQSLERSGL